MKSETYMSARIKDDVRLQMDYYGPADKLLQLIEEEACAIFKELRDNGYPDTLEAMRLFVNNIAERVFNDGT